MISIVLIIYALAFGIASGVIIVLIRNDRYLERKMKKDLEDEEYLNGLIEKAAPNWKGIDAEKWLNEIRGDYD